MEHIAFGQFFQQMRRKQGLSLRKFCKENRLDPGNISKLERGKLSPPTSHNKLTGYTELLGIEKESDEWYKFFDLAAACSGTIPQDVMNDKQIVAKLPLVFRTLRGQEPSSDDLNEIIEIIRKS